MRILFVCKGNRFRSISAEAIFNFLNKDKNIKTESAGLNLDLKKNYICKNVLELLREKGYTPKKNSRQLTREISEKADMIVIVANNIDKEFFHDYFGILEKWEIDDVDELKRKKINAIIGQIEEKVRDLILRLENKKL